MNEDIICKQIFDCALAEAQKREAPISYVNVELGFFSSVDDKILWSSFNKMKWDTPISNSELFLDRRPMDNEHSKYVKLVSLTEFEDEHGHAAIVPINRVISE